MEQEKTCRNHKSRCTGADPKRPYSVTPTTAHGGKTRAGTQWSSGVLGGRAGRTQGFWAVALLSVTCDGHVIRYLSTIDESNQE
jgi:hypothetical protein